MDWVLGYPRVAKVYRQLLNDRIWGNFAARSEVGRLLQTRGALLNGTVPFGNLKAPVTKMDGSYINARSVVAAYTDPLDDLFGALGSFTFRVAVQGVMSPLRPGSFEIVIEQAGIYVYDSYDFQDDHWISQPLGFWSFEEMATFPSYRVSLLSGLQQFVPTVPGRKGARWRLLGLLGCKDCQRSPAG